MVSGGSSSGSSGGGDVFGTLISHEGTCVFFISYSWKKPRCQPQLQSGAGAVVLRGGGVVGG